MTDNPQSNENKTTQMISPEGKVSVEAAANMAAARAAQQRAGEYLPPKVVKVAPGKKLESPRTPKYVKVELLKPFQYGDELYEPGTVLELDDRLAEKLCARKEGHFSFSGERPDGETARHDMTRAKKVN